MSVGIFCLRCNFCALRDGDLWISRRILTGWSTPEKLAGLVSTGADEFYASQTNDGFLYFTRAVGGRQVILRVQLSSSDNQAEEFGASY